MHTKESVMAETSTLDRAAIVCAEADNCAHRAAAIRDVVNAVRTGTPVTAEAA